MEGSSLCADMRSVSSIVVMDFLALKNETPGMQYDRLNQLSVELLSTYTLIEGFHTRAGPISLNNGSWS